jgi:sugar phosphate isomerase/epimerase
MDVGVVSRSFPKLTNKETADLMCENGFRWTELCFACKDSNYWVYNGRSDISGLTDNESKRIIMTYRDQGIEITSIGVFTNLIDPDEDERRKNLDYYVRHIQIASDNGIRYVATECGFIPGRRGVFFDTYEEDYSRLADSLLILSDKAKQYDVYIALEPCVLDVVPSAKRAADLIARLGSDRIKILLDPANLIANSSEEDMFKYLSPYIAYFHGKDRKVDDRLGRVVGDGDINWPLFLGLYHKYTDNIPFILEYVNAENFAIIRDRVLEADKTLRCGK